MLLPLLHPCHYPSCPFLHPPPPVFSTCRQRQRELEKELDRRADLLRERQRQVGWLWASTGWRDCGRLDTRQRIRHRCLACAHAALCLEHLSMLLPSSHDIFAEARPPPPNTRTHTRVQVHADNEATHPESDEEEEPWRRRRYSGSRRAADRRRRREAELAEDAADRRREEAEAAAREKEQAAAAAATPVGRDAPVEAGGAAFSADDTILQAMLAAVKAKPEPSPAAAGPAATVPAPAANAAAGKRRVMTAFAEDDDEEKPQRKLIPIRQGGWATRLQGYTRAPCTQHRDYLGRGAPQPWSAWKPCPASMPCRHTRACWLIYNVTSIGCMCRCLVACPAYASGCPGAECPVGLDMLCLPPWAPARAVSSLKAPSSALVCRYSEEELRALQEQPEGQQQLGALPEAQHAAQPAAPPPAAAPADPAALKKQLLQLIPKDKAGVFGYPIKWAVLDAAPAVRDKISGEAAAGMCVFGM